MSEKGKNTASNPSGTLYDYPTSELKNLAKEYNLAYYINNIDRLSKNKLVEAIEDHMEWKKSQELIDNKVEFSKSLEGIKLNYDKTRNKHEPRPRMNYAELKKKHPILVSPQREIPDYKGKKEFGEKHLKALHPDVKEALKETPPSVAEILGYFRSLTKAQQRNLIDNLGLTEAEVLPEGVPALGEMEGEEEKKVANTIHQVIEELHDTTEKVVPKKTWSLDEYKALLGAPPKSWKGYFPKIDQWRYVTLAEELIKDPSLSQSKLGKILEKKGWTVGTSQSFISKQLAIVDKLKLIPRKGGVIVDPKHMEGHYKAVWSDDQSKVVDQTLFDNPVQTEKILRIAHDLSTVLENTNPAEALGWRIIYQELYEFQKRRRKEYIIPASNDPEVLKPYTQEISGLDPEAYKIMLKKQKNHGAHIEMLLLKAVRGLREGQRKAIGREASSYLVPTIFELETKLKKLVGIDKDKDFRAWEEKLLQLQHFPLTHKVKELYE